MLIHGFSSLLFIISFIKACYASDLILWKVSNIFIIFASALCNVYDYREDLLILDYASIIFFCLSYINNFYVNFLYTSFILYEYNTLKSIEVSKNIVVATALSKSIVYTYLYVDNQSFYIILTSSIGGGALYIIRYILLKRNIHTYRLLITYFFHICMTGILYVASMTAKN